MRHGATQMFRAQDVLCLVRRIEHRIAPFESAYDRMKIGRPDLLPFPNRNDRVVVVRLPLARVWYEAVAQPYAVN